MKTTTAVPEQGLMKVSTEATPEELIAYINGNIPNINRDALHITEHVEGCGIPPLDLALAVLAIVFNQLTHTEEDSRIFHDHCGVALASVMEQFSQDADTIEPPVPAVGLRDLILKNLAVVYAQMQFAHALTAPIRELAQGEPVGSA